MPVVQDQSCQQPSASYAARRQKDLGFAQQ